MNSNEAAPQMVAETPEAVVEDNVREIFPGASRSTPVVNHGTGPGTEANAGPSLSTVTGVGTGVCPAGVHRFVVERTKNGLESGMATAEYAIATLAAVGFAGLLVVILKSDEVRGFLLNIIRTALSF